MFTQCLPGPVGKIGKTDGTEWAGPVSGAIDYERDMDMGREWAGRVGLKVHEIQIEGTTLVKGEVVVSVREIG